MKTRRWLCILLALSPVAFMPLRLLGEESTLGLGATLGPRLAQIRQLEGSFEQIRHISVLSVPLRSSGQFTYRQGEGIVWRTLEPVESVVRITPGQGVVVVDDSGNPQPVPASELVGGIFLGIFSGDFSRLKEYFAVEEQPGGAGLEAGHWQLRLTPLQAGLAEHLQAIDIRGAELVEAITLREANGDCTEIIFKTKDTSGELH